MNEFCLVLVTAPTTEEAETIAGKIVEKELAACVNIVPKIRSIYRWQGEVQEDREVLMLIKTSARHLEKLKKRILKMHSYDIPEFLVFNVDEGDEAYLKWMGSTLR